MSDTDEPSKKKSTCGPPPIKKSIAELTSNVISIDKGVSQVLAELAELRSSITSLHMLVDNHAKTALQAPQICPVRRLIDHTYLGRNTNNGEEGNWDEQTHGQPLEFEDEDTN